jgi:hypothetical protein
MAKNVVLVFHTTYRDYCCLFKLSFPVHGFRKMNVNVNNVEAC